MKTSMLTLSFVLCTTPSFAASVALTWVDPSVAPSKAANFAVCRLVPNTTAYEEIARPTTTSYTDATAPVGAVSYKVRAITAAGDMSDYSTPWAGTVPAAPVKPAAPTNLNGTISTTTTMEAPGTTEAPPAAAPPPADPPVELPAGHPVGDAE
jgi:hypothetical protein